MTRPLTVLATLTLAFPFVAMAQSTTPLSSTAASISEHNVRAEMATAHTVDQYKQIATYFHLREASLRAKAAAEKTELERRAQVNAGLYQKYPRPVDSAQSLYESYVSDADSAAAHARHYDQLSMTPAKQSN